MVLPGFRQASIEPPTTPDPSKAGDSSWTIILVGIYAPDDPPGAREVIANDTLRKVQTQGGLPEAYIDARPKATVIAYGHYPHPDDPAAHRDLARVRAITVDGAQPFADSYLAPPPAEAFRGSIPEYDLRGARAQFGLKRAKYTLQVGVYGEADPKAPIPSAKELKEIRAAAEQAAVELRREGELAFYYHAPIRSMVTIGVFSDKDIDAKQPGGEAESLRKLRERQPYNLLNGKGLRELVKGEKDKDGKPVYRMQASRLVSVPD